MAFVESTNVKAPDACLYADKDNSGPVRRDDCDLARWFSASRLRAEALIDEARMATALVWSLDGDFERLARLGFAELY